MCSSQCYYILGGRECANLLIMGLEQNTGRSAVMSCVPVSE